QSAAERSTSVGRISFPFWRRTYCVTRSRRPTRERIASRKYRRNAASSASTGRRISGRLRGRATAAGGARAVSMVLSVGAESYNGRRGAGLPAVPFFRTRRTTVGRRRRARTQKSPPPLPHFPSPALRLPEQRLADGAVEAAAGGAPGAVELVEALCGEGALGARARGRVQPRHLVLGARQRLRHAPGGLVLREVPALLGVEEEDGQHGVHQDPVGALPPDGCGGGLGRRPLEADVRPPERVRLGRLDQRAQRGGRARPHEGGAEAAEGIPTEQPRLAVTGGRCEERGGLRDTEGREVGGPEAEELPLHRLHRSERRAAAEALEACAEVLDVVGGVLVALLHRRAVGQQPGGAEQRRLDIAGVVEAAEGDQGEAPSQLGHRVRVLAVAEGTEDRGVEELREVGRGGVPGGEFGRAGAEAHEPELAQPRRLHLVPHPGPETGAGEVGPRAGEAAGEEAREGACQALVE